MFHVKDGVCTEITGGTEAKFVRHWMESLKDPNMYHEAHICYGLNPGARASGICIKDERIWGVTEWGFGHQGIQFQAGGLPAVSHLDGICLNSSVWQNGEQALDHGLMKSPWVAWDQKTRTLRVARDGYAGIVYDWDDATVRFDQIRRKP